MYQKEWGKILINPKNKAILKSYLEKRNVNISNNKHLKEINEGYLWCVEGDDEVTNAHNKKENELLWEFLTKIYKFEENEIVMINSLLDEFKTKPKKGIFNVQTLFFDNEINKALKYQIEELD
jgi:hypothetical protein